MYLYSWVDRTGGPEATEASFLQSQVSEGMGYTNFTKQHSTKKISSMQNPVHYMPETSMSLSQQFFFVCFFNSIMYAMTRSAHENTGFTGHEKSECSWQNTENGLLLNLHILLWSLKNAAFIRILMKFSKTNKIFTGSDKDGQDKNIRGTV